MTEQEKKTLKKIRKQLGQNHKPYMFWFVDSGTSWEGGTELSLGLQFRNQYTIIAGNDYVYGKCIKNW